MKKGANNTYLGSIGEGINSVIKGLKLTLTHLWEARKNRKPIGIDNADYFTQDTGIVTLQYPYESIPVPDNGRYRLHNEMDDCIVCDLCAKICPVNCIDIEPIKSTEEIGKTSDGSTKRIYAAKFDIDMAKCCYCGLCTTVCPTECLTMTKTYDYSEFDIRNMVYHYTDLSPDQAIEKKSEYEEKQKQKLAAKNVPGDQKSVSGSSVIKDKLSSDTEVKKPAFKPTFKPVIKPVIPPKKEEGENENQKQ